MARDTRSRSNQTLETLVVVHELDTGDCLVLPLGDPSLASCGPLEAALEEQRLFLGEYLANEHVDVAARFAFPAATSLLTVHVALPREDLPRKLQVQSTIAVPCAVVPHGRDRWVIALPLRHTFHVGPDEELEDAIRTEVRRIGLAQDLTPDEYAALLPHRRTELQPLLVTLDRAEALAEGRSARRQIVEARRRKHALDVLESVARIVPRPSAPPPLLDRDAERRQLASLLGAKDRLSVALVGTGGVGKSALLEAWLAAEPRGHREVFATSGARLVAGMSGFGQWQERVRRVMEAAETRDCILYFENLGDLFSDRPDSHVDFPRAMRRWLEERRVRVVGELTPEALGAAELRYAGFLAQFQTVRVPALSTTATRSALEAHIAHHRRHDADHPTLSAEAVDTVLDLVERYQPYGANPGKALRLVGEVRAAAHRTSVAAPESTSSIGSDEVYTTFSTKTGVPLFLLRDDVSLKRAEVIGFFARRVVGQEEAVERIAAVVTTVKARLQPTGKPLASFLFVGPTGVGKTELAKCLATFLFGSADRLVRFDMSEYQDPSAAERLIRGTDRREGLLTRRIRQQPFAVLLLDEIEKADSSVFDLLLQVLGEGRLSDARGRTAFFQNAIVILTSNLGASHRSRSIGLGAAELSDRGHYEKEVRRHFRPELVNRIDRVIPFRPLSAAEARTIAEMNVRRIRDRRGLSDIGATLELGAEALDALARRGYSEHYGARALRRHLEEELVAPLARALGEAGAHARDARVVADASDDGVSFRLEPRPASLRRNESRGLAALSRIRREVDRWFGFPPVEEVAEQVQFLLARLAATPKDKRRKKTNEPEPPAAADLGPLQQEYHRLAQLHERAVSLRGELHTMEELALQAFLEGDDAHGLAADAERTLEAFRRLLLKLLAAVRPGRDEITLLLQELDGPAFDDWLVPLIEAGASRQWRLTFHVDQDADREGWPGLEERRFGPPRTPEAIRERLESSRRPARALLLRAQGPLAGAILSAECGLQRFRPAEGDPRHLLATRLTLRAHLDKDDWRHRALLPVMPANLEVVRRHPVVRDHWLERGEVRLFGAKEQDVALTAPYWHGIDEIALRHFILCLDREPLGADTTAPDFESLWTGPLDEARTGEEDA